MVGILLNPQLEGRELMADRVMHGWLGYFFWVDIWSGFPGSLFRRKKDGVVWAAAKAARTCPSFWVRFSVSETGRACRFTGFSASAFLLLLSVFPRVHQALLQLGLQVLLLYCCRQRLTLEVHELHVHQRGVRKLYLRNLSFRNNTLQQTCAQFFVSHDDSKH